jgi:CubicO group peptidase (beta-lactamase class C family)
VSRVDHESEPSYWSQRLTDLATAADVPGAVLGVLAGGERSIDAHGVLNRATGVEVTPGSLFQIGSVTKLWTATMVMQLVDEGRLSLGDTVEDLLPDVRLAAADAVSVGHLLTHTSGIDGDIFTDTGRGDDCVDRYVRLLGSAQQVFDPGAAYSYCNAGFVVLGRIVEVLDGRTWDASLRARLVEPLGLDETVTLPEEAILRRAAVGHTSGGLPVHSWQLPRSIGPAGLVTQSAADLLTFASAQIDNGASAWSAGSAEAMVEPRVPIPWAAGGLTHVGLAWRIYDWSGRRVIGHDGLTMAQMAYLRIDPQARLAVCLLTNSDNAPALAQSIVSEVFEEYAGVPMPVPAGPAPGIEWSDLPDAGRHLGRYERAGVTIDVAVEGGVPTMTAEATGDRIALAEEPRHEYRLHPADQSGTRFVTRETDDQPWVPVSFDRLADGRAYLFTSGRVTPKVTPT